MTRMRSIFELTLLLCIMPKTLRGKELSNLMAQTRFRTGKFRSLSRLTKLYAVYPPFTAIPHWRVFICSYADSPGRSRKEHPGKERDHRSHHEIDSFPHSRCRPGRAPGNCDR